VARVRALADADPDAYRIWVAHHDSICAQDVQSMRRIAASFAQRPLVSILTPVYNTDRGVLCAMIESVRAQTYENWELCLVDDASTRPHVREVLEGYASLDARIKVAYRSERGHISRASNSALALASGSWVALLDHDDLLAAHALFCVVEAINRLPDVKLIYSDEDKIDADGTRQSPYLKPDWNPDLFLSHSLIGHLGVYRTELVRAIGGFPGGVGGSPGFGLAPRYGAQIEGCAHDHLPPRP